MATCRRFVGSNAIGAEVMGNDALSLEVESIRSLVDALRWAQGRTPPAAFVDAVAQDEFTHDVVIRVDDGAFVVLDTS